MQKWKQENLNYTIIATGCLLFILLVELAATFKEGWVFDGFPHCYLHTAQHVYYDHLEEIPSGNEFYGHASDYNDNPIFSPVYLLTTVFGFIGEPTPPWFRLYGLVFVAIIFIIAYRFPRPGSPKLDRLLTAVIVTTTPVVLFAGRFVEDHIVHMMLLLVGALLLSKNLTKPKSTTTWPFFILPAVDILFTHMFTNFLVFIMSLAGMYAVSLGIKIKTKPGLRQVVIESCLILGAFFLLFGAIHVRFPAEQLGSVLGYYFSQAGEDYVQPVSIFRRILAFPETIFFSSVGVLYCLLALLTFSHRFRITQSYLCLGWAMPPLILLLSITKKNSYYIWYVSVGLALLAACAATKLGMKWKWLLILICLLFTPLHLFEKASPLEELVNPKAFQDKFHSLKAQPPIIKDNAMLLSLKENAKLMLQAASVCGDITGRPLMYFKLNSYKSLEEIHFLIQNMDRRPRYVYLDTPRLELPYNLIAVQLLNDFPWPKGWAQASWKEKAGPEDVVEQFNNIRMQFPVQLETNTMKVYCHQSGSSQVEN